MRIECLFRSAVCNAREKCVEDSGGVQPRQENSAECGTKLQHQVNFSGFAHSHCTWPTIVEHSRLCLFPCALVLGFDGGGTKTDCVLMDEDRGDSCALAFWLFQPPRLSALEASLTALSAAATDALRAAERSEQDCSYVLGGVSGAARVEHALGPDARSAAAISESYGYHKRVICLLSLEATGEIPSVVVMPGRVRRFWEGPPRSNWRAPAGLGGDWRSGERVRHRQKDNRGYYPETSEQGDISSGSEDSGSFQCKFDEFLDHARSRPGDVFFPRYFPSWQTLRRTVTRRRVTLLSSAAQDLLIQARRGHREN